MIRVIYTVVFFIAYIVIQNIAIASNFLVFGDFGTGDSNQKLVADDMHTYCKAKGNCDFALTVGDNVYPKGVENLLRGKENYDDGAPNYKIIYDYFIKNYHKFAMPFYMVFGNHDIGNEGVKSIFKDLFKNRSYLNKRTSALMNNEINYTQNSANPIVTNKAGEKLRLWYFPKPFYTVKEKENLTLLALDTNNYPHKALQDNGELDLAHPQNKGQQEWLKKNLTNVSGWKIVFGHMPLYSHGKHGWQDAGAIKEFRNSIIDLLCQQKVDFYFSGHDHHLEVNRHICSNGHVITAVISGAAAKEDRLYECSFPLFGEDKNLIWGNGKLYKGSRLIYKNDDKVLGFAHIAIDGQKALLTMRLAKGLSVDRHHGCFEVTQGKSVNVVPCKGAEALKNTHS